MARRVRKKNERDRLSSLPDSVIHHILSFLDTKYAVQTCVLSKRWKHLWTCLPSLNFDSDSFKNLGSFKTFVDLVLFYIKRKRKPSNLKRLKFHNWSHDQSFIDKVTRYAVNHFPQEIDLYGSFCHRNILLSCPSLRKVHLRNFRICADDFSRCVNLETLVLDECWFANNYVKISSPRFSSFTYRGEGLSRFFEFMLDGCPNLDRFDLHLRKVYPMDKKERLAELKNRLKQLMLRTKLLVVRMEGLMVKTILVKDDVHVIIYNETTTARKELFWQAADENFGLYLSRLLQRCEKEMQVAGTR